MQGLFTSETGPKITEAQASFAHPPFPHFKSPDVSFLESDDALFNGVAVVPIHMPWDPTYYLLSIYGAGPLCPIMDTISKMYASRGAKNMTILKPLIDEIKLKMPEINAEDLAFENVNKVIDGFLCA